MHNNSNVNGEDTGSGVIPRRLVRVSTEAARVGAPATAAHSHEPQVEMIREGDILRAIDVTCSCGKRIRLRCVNG